MHHAMGKSAKADPALEQVALEIAYEEEPRTASQKHALGAEEDRTFGARPIIVEAAAMRRVEGRDAEAAPGETSVDAALGTVAVNDVGCERLAYSGYSVGGAQVRQ